MISHTELKRLFDMGFAVCVLLIVWPLILIGAVAVKLTSRGPAFYKAKRAGRGGKLFYMYKLRTMRIGADAPDRKITEEQDDRIMPVGRWLRRFEIDELPQFWNVLRGEMSIVGPRPEDWDIVERYYTLEQRRTLEVRPGVVSPFDVHWYPDITYHDPPPAGVSLQDWYLTRHRLIQLAEAQQYIEHANLLLDGKVIVQTIYCVLIRSWLLPPKKHPPVLAEYDASRAGKSLHQPNG